MVTVRDRCAHDTTSNTTKVGLDDVFTNKLKEDKKKEQHHESKGFVCE